MAAPPDLPGGEVAYANDPYELQVIIEAAELGSREFFAQVKTRPGASGDPLAEFTVDAEQGTGDEEDNIILVLSLTGDDTAVLAAAGGLHHCDLQEVDGLTFLRWKLRTLQDVSREAGS